jgi:hypothetical protein
VVCVSSHFKISTLTQQNQMRHPEMQKMEKKYLLWFGFATTALGAAIFVSSCTVRKFGQNRQFDSNFVPPEHRPPSKWWNEIYSKRLKNHLDYAKKNTGGTLFPGEGLRWFRDFPVGFIGAPLMLFKALPQLAPEIYGSPESNFSTIGFGQMPPADWNKGASLPLGLGYTHSDLELPSVMEDGTKTSFVPPIAVVTLSCGACHIGRLRLRKNESNVAKDYSGTDNIPSVGYRTAFLVGAPNTEFDPQLFRRSLERFAESSHLEEANLRTTAERISKIVQSFQKSDEVFGHTGIHIKSLFLKLDMAFEKKFIYGNPETLVAMLRTLKAGVLEGRDLLAELSSRAYPDRTHLGGNPAPKPSTAGQTQSSTELNGTPGQFDAFGFASIAFSGTFGYDKHTIQNFRDSNIGHAPGLADAMSVWRQDLRPYGNWNGNMKDKFYRNLGASAGGAGSSVATDIQNVDIVTKFVENLPSPPYPFDVNPDLASRGQKLFNTHCAQCHGTKTSGWEGDAWSVSPVQFHEALKRPLWIDVGTDSSRRLIQSSASALRMVEELKLGCEKRHLRLQVLVNRKVCDKSVNEILAPPETTRTGYVVPNLSGVWARAPYLHNGSIPNLRSLLKPPSERPKKFVRGLSFYDAINVGFVSDESSIEKEFGKLTELVREYSGISIFDTQLLGRSNKGHYNLRVANLSEVEGGKAGVVIDSNGSWPTEEKEIDSLLEYLKTL